MKAGVLHKKRDMRYEEFELPALDPHEVRVKVKYTGICGSDVPRVNGDACHFFPMILGHEFSGTVCEVGAAVTSYQQGDRVAGIPLVPCMECEDCAQGNYSLCKQYSFIGSRRYGSMAEYVDVPSSNLFPIADDVSFLEGALFEPSTVALHALRLANVTAGSVVAVVGCGLIGLFCMQWARILGARKVIAINRSKGKLALAREVGANDVISTLDEGWEEHLLELTAGRGADFVLDASGNGDMMKKSLACAANRGTVCMVGTPKDAMTFSVKEWELLNRKELTLTGSWMSYSAPWPGEEWEKTAQCFASGELWVKDEMIDTIYPLSRIAEAFERYNGPEPVRGKLLIDSES